VIDVLVQKGLPIIVEEQMDQEWRHLINDLSKPLERHILGSIGSVTPNWAHRAGEVTASGGFNHGRDWIKEGVGEDRFSVQEVLHQICRNFGPSAVDWPDAMALFIVYRYKTREDFPFQLRDGGIQAGFCGPWILVDQGEARFLRFPTLTRVELKTSGKCHGAW